MVKTAVIYHANCWDGIAAAWCAQSLGDFDYYPLNYGEPVPDMSAYGYIFILDFSLPKEVLISWVQDGKQVELLDHHKTAFESLGDLVGTNHNLRITLDMEQSGCGLAWNRFYPQTEMPMILQYIQDRDLWRFLLPNSQEINATIRTYPLTMETISHLVENVSLRTLAKIGKPLLRQEEQYIKSLASQVEWQSIGGAFVPVAHSPILFSQLAEYLHQTHNTAFAGVYFDRADGVRQYSLRSKPGFDVSSIAKAYGGGGHANAAGFELKEGVTLDNYSY